MVQKECYLDLNKQIFPKICLESFRNLSTMFINPVNEFFDEIRYAEL